MALAAGININQYRIAPRLGSGGMGEVYLVQDERRCHKSTGGNFGSNIP